MKRKLKGWSLTSLILSIAFSLQAQTKVEGSYTTVVTGFDWGPAVNKVILSTSIPMDAVAAQDFKVMVSRSSDIATIGPNSSSGERVVLSAFASDGTGTPNSDGEFIGLALAVAPNNPLGSPIQYYRGEGGGGNIWIDYKMTVVHLPTQTTWNTEGNRIHTILDEFDTSGTYTHSY